MYLAVGIGGILGAVLRFLIYKWLLIAGHIPLAGTLCVNLSGCFILGYLQGLARIYELPKWFVLGVGTGFIGAFTTFSTFSIEVVSYFDKGYIVFPAFYLLASSIGGYVLVYFGFSLTSYKKKDV
ncbi:fluoride efflux transporter CrcB [Bacillus sp. EB600]|uniref:fluoride efflux transporter CrcB n=1 Tax=Bacillus sp. EB600 TaxID=2806345 RepID=UPI00210A51BF|nr:fluoride efflux transporter CrcB [Bacillus sp. EB600]MCQ6282112.1 fluoride efflux transporter CrcB [Bacillus sp. EB600]